MILFTGHGAIFQEFIKHFDAEVISLRFADKDELSYKISNCDILIHNSAGINFKSSIDFYNNYFLTKQLIDIVRSINPAIKIVNISSMSILESEYRYKSIQEMSDYSKSKYLSEIFCLNQKDLNIINVRFSTLFYKDRYRDGLSFLGYKAVKENEITLFNDGVDKRDFIPLNVAICYLYNIALLDEYPPVVNIASGKSHCFKEFADYLKRQVDNLRINNKSMYSKPVLAEFTDIEKLLPVNHISYSIFEEFDKFISSIK